MIYLVRRRPDWVRLMPCECGAPRCTHYGLVAESEDDPTPAPVRMGCEMCMRRWARERRSDG